MFAKALATHGNCNFVSVSPDDILDEFIGNSEKKMKKCFESSQKMARDYGNSSIIFFDECDRLFQKPGRNDCKVISNIQGIFQVVMDGVHKPKGQVVVLAATNYKERLPEAIRSRFQKEIKIDRPHLSERVEIIKLVIGKSTKSIRSNMKESDFNQLGEDTKGASGRDLKMLVKNTLDVRRTSTKEYDGLWCKDRDGIYVPCACIDINKCQAERFSYVGRPEGYEARPPPLSYNHFDDAIKTYGVSPNDQEE